MSPCQSCGACCASYRVSFPCHEVDDLPGGSVPAALVEEIAPHVVCMRGTGSAPMRCVALRGTVGEAVFCAIYEFRSSACRDFAPLAALGRGDEACNEARRRHGLTPLAVAA